MTTFSTFRLQHVYNFPYFPQVINNSVDGRVYAELASSIIKTCRTVGLRICGLYGLISLPSGMSFFRQILATVLVLTMAMTICSTCVAEAMASSCCTEPCTECACGFEAMSLDADPIKAVVIPAPVSFEPLIAFSVVQAPSDIARRTSRGWTRGSYLPIPLSSSIRLSLLSVYLI